MVYDISIIIPVYNVELYLTSCLNSLLEQSFQGTTQIILIEDKSSDSSAIICRDYEQKYDNIILIEHDENGGSAVARNTGLDQVDGKYFLFVDPDDILPKAALYTLFNAIEESNSDIVKGNNTSFKSHLKPKLVAYSVLSHETYYDEDCLTVLLEHEKLRGHPWGKIFRTDVFRYERFTPGYRMAEDLLYCAEVFKKACNVLLIPDVVYQYRIHRGGATGRKYETGAYLSWIKCITNIEPFITAQSQSIAYQKLKIRSLALLAREVRYLKGKTLESVLEVVDQTREKWLPPFWQLLLHKHLSATCVVRYMKYSLAIRKARLSL